MTEKNNGQWTCKECGKAATLKRDIIRHAETHIGGVSLVCHICSKTLSTRASLQVHISGNHSELFSCEVCGKSGMNRKALNNHKRRDH